MQGNPSRTPGAEERATNLQICFRHQWSGVYPAYRRIPVWFSPSMVLVAHSLTRCRRLMFIATTFLSCPTFFPRDRRSSLLLVQPFLLLANIATIDTRKVLSFLVREHQSGTRKERGDLCRDMGRKTNVSVRGRTFTTIFVYETYLFQLQFSGLLKSPFVEVTFS